MVLGFYRLLAELLRIDYDMLPYLKTLAQAKQRTCLEYEETVADEFFDMITGLKQDAMSTFLDIKDGIIWIHKPSAEKTLKDQNFPLGWRSTELMEALKDHPAFLFSNKTHRINHKVQKAWGFDISKMPLAQDGVS